MWNHQVQGGIDNVLGKVTDMAELGAYDPRNPADLRAKGYGSLLVRGQLNMRTQSGRDAYEHIVAGDLKQYSFMYESESTADQKRGIRLLTKIAPVYECSLVVIGMNPLTRTVTAKTERRLFG